VTQFGPFKLIIIGERISPGYKSAKALIDSSDIAGLQELSRKQADAGASYLDVHLGSRAVTDPPFVEQVVRGIQASVSTPLCFDFAELEAQQSCLRTYDRALAGGALPIVNSITEPRWELMDLTKIAPFKVVVMCSERVEGGVPKSNKTGSEIAGTAKRCAARLAEQYGMPMEDIFIDVSVRAIIADTEGMTRSVLDAIRLIREDPQLRGVHVMGALTNIGQQMPPKAADGSELKLALENAFLTIAVPNGLDTIMGTPWREYQPLPDDHYVMKVFRAFLEQSGTNALRAVRKFYRA
jgi:5-methyltetrahydrofolate--homocysteine methyltransferase